MSVSEIYFLYTVTYSLEEQTPDVTVAIPQLSQQQAFSVAALGKINVLHRVINVTCLCHIQHL